MLYCVRQLCTIINTHTTSNGENIMQLITLPLVQTGLRMRERGHLGHYCLVPIAYGKCLSWSCKLLYILTTFIYLWLFLDFWNSIWWLWHSSDQWLKYAFWGPGTLLKYWPLLCVGAPKLHYGPGQSYLRHGLLLAVDAKVVKGHTLWHVYTANKMKTAKWLEEADRQMIQLTCCTCGGPVMRIPV